MSVGVVLGVLALRRHPRTGGAVLGIAVLMKVWPIVLLPVLARQRKHAAVSTVMVVGAGSAIWMVWGGIDAIRQVAGFRGATGWSLGSTVGSIVWVLTGGPVTLEAGSPRTGVASLPWRVALLVALIAVCLLAYRWARAWRGDPFGLPSLTVLGALLIASPLFSLQYACWLAPSIAIAWDEDDRPTATPGAIAVALTGATFALVQVSGGGVATRLTLLARNASVAWMMIVGLRSMARRSSDAEVTSSHP